MEKQLSEHLSVKEFTFSPTAVRYEIPNNMPHEHYLNAVALAKNVFEPLRAHVGKPIKINSGYRSMELNKRVGGAKNSQHNKGEAMDLPITNNDALWVMHNLVFDQMIFEFPNASGDASWIHISYTTAKKNRKQVLIAVKRDGKTVYLPFQANKHLVIFK